MIKGKKWLKEKIKNTQPDFVPGYDLKVISKDEVYDLIDQLDERDINQAYKDGYDTGRMHASKIKKPVIPPFVAEMEGEL